MTAADYVVLMPVYDDWDAVTRLLSLLETELSSQRQIVDVVCVDDCSSSPAPCTLRPSGARAIGSLRVLRLKRNLGHQRALAVGLCQLSQSGEYRGIIVMDADGEDLPSDVPRLISEYEDSGRRRPVFAQRMRRSEGVVFTLFYHAYRALHRLFTGVSVQVGNFSIIPSDVARRLAVSSELWNHYAAAVVHSRVPMQLMPTVRGRRLSGESRMNFVSLVAHGLSAMSVFADRIGVRLLVVTSVALMVLGLGVIAAIAVRFLTDLAIPGWATVATGVLAVLIAQGGMLALVFVFMVQRGRGEPTFIPGRDTGVFIDSITQEEI